MVLQCFTAFVKVDTPTSFRLKQRLFPGPTVDLPWFCNSPRLHPPMTWLLSKTEVLTVSPWLQYLQSQLSSLSTQNSELYHGWCFTPSTSVVKTIPSPDSASSPDARAPPFLQSAFIKQWPQAKPTTINRVEPPWRFLDDQTTSWFCLAVKSVLSLTFTNMPINIPFISHDYPH